MEPVENKDVNTPQQNGRRRFLMRAGLGSLPVLLTLKSKAAWGTSTLNCSLSETASQMQSVQPDKYEQCRSGFDSHGSAKLYFKKTDSKVGGGKGGYFYKPKGTKNFQWTKKWGGLDICQDTRFNDVFFSGFNGTLEEAVNFKGGNPLIRNIASSFLHSLYYQSEGISSNFPPPESIVDVYTRAVTPEQRAQLSAVLEFYIDGYTG